MEVRHLSLPASDPEALGRWYGQCVGVADGDDVRLGESRLRFHRVDNAVGRTRSHRTEGNVDGDANAHSGIDPRASETHSDTDAYSASDTDNVTDTHSVSDEPPPAHLAMRTDASPAAVAAWLDRTATHCRIDGEPSRYFEFLDAEAVYGLDPAGNVIEWLCEPGSARSSTPDDDTANTGSTTAEPSRPACKGLTEVGLPAPEPPALVAWLTDTVGLPTWGTPSERFAWVGDRTARFVVIPAGSEWYPTEQVADSEPISATVADSNATPGTYEHPELPYEIIIIE